MCELALVKKTQKMSTCIRISTNNATNIPQTVNRPPTPLPTRPLCLHPILQARPTNDQIGMCFSCPSFPTHPHHGRLIVTASFSGTCLVHTRLCCRVQETFELNQLKSAPSQLLPVFPGFDRLQTCCH